MITNIMGYLACELIKKVGYQAAKKIFNINYKSLTRSNNHIAEPVKINQPDNASTSSLINNVVNLPLPHTDPRSPLYQSEGLLASWEDVIETVRIVHQNPILGARKKLKS